MGRKPSKPKDPTYAAIEAMVAQSGLNARTQDEVTDFSKMFMKAFLERALRGEMNHFLKQEQSGEEGLDSSGNSRNGYGEKTVAAKRSSRAPEPVYGADDDFDLEFIDLDDDDL